MRWACLLLVLVACLDEPDPPPGHGYEMRDDVLVADLDGDGFDDLVTLGHDGDPRQTSEVFVRWGGDGLSADADQTISIPTSQTDCTWHEAIAVAFAPFQSPPELVVVTGDDLGPPPNGKNARAIQIWTLPVIGKSVGEPTPTLTDEVIADDFGGYARMASTAFIAPYRPATGGARVLLGDHDRLLGGPLGSDLDPSVKLTFPADEYLWTGFTIPPAAGTQVQDPLLVTSRRAVQIDVPQDPLPAGSALPSRDAVTASARAIAGLWVAASDPMGTAISIVKVTDNASGIEVYAADYGRQAEHLSIADFNYAKGTMGVASIFNGHISVAYGLALTDPVTFSDPSHVDLDADNESVLAVGHFASDHDEIITFDATDRTHRPTCWYYNERTQTVDHC